MTGRQEWLKKRSSGIGGSDAAAVIGRNPWLSNVDLWQIKTGRKQQADISDKEVVKYGIAAEGYLISLFALDNPQYDVKHVDFDILRHNKHPFLLASLDGRLIERDTGRKGVLEIKTTEIRRASDWDKWDDQVPDNYYCQVLHYLSVTGWDFAILKAQIKHYQKQQALTVEMETSAFYAACARLRVRGVSAFVVSDSLHKLRWEPDFKNAALGPNLRRLFDCARRTLNAK